MHIVDVRPSFDPPRPRCGLCGRRLGAAGAAGHGVGDCVAHDYTEEIRVVWERYRAMAEGRFISERAVYTARLREGAGKSNGAASWVQAQNDSIRMGIMERAGVVLLADRIAVDLFQATPLGANSAWGLKGCRVQAAIALRITSGIGPYGPIGPEEVIASLCP